MAWANGLSARKTGAVVVALLALSLLALAPVAQAAKGVYDSFGGSGTEGGRFGAGPAGIAVNETSGEIYVVDESLQRVQRFDSDGNFISTWGMDVVKDGAPGDTGTGFEICTVAQNCKQGKGSNQISEGPPGTLGGEFGSPQGVAVNQVTGDIYVTERDNRRVQQFTAAGTFIRAWGRDVVQSGQPGDTPAASAKQTLTVSATGGKYTLEFQGQKTDELLFSTDAAQIQAALTALGTIGAGNVEVSGSPGSPYTITFKGAHADNPEPDIIAGSTLGDPLTGGSVSVTTTTPGSNGFEICSLAASCKEGSFGASGGAFAPRQGRLPSLAVAPVGAPNVGNVLVSDLGNNRVQEFTSSGAFVRAFGWDVSAAGPGDTGAEFEICRASIFDACKEGVSGSAAGQFSGIGPSGILAEDSFGRIYTVEATDNFRVQRFAQSGPSLTPEVFNTEIGGGEFLTGSTVDKAPTGVAIGPAGTVLVAKRFPVGTGTPPAVKDEQRVLEFSSTGGLLDSHPVGADFPLNQIGGFGASMAPGGPIYLTRFGVQGDPRAFILDEVPPILITPEATEAGATTATLHASITPSQSPVNTLYRFEYAKAGSGEWKQAPAPPAPDVSIGNGSSPVAVSQVAEGLSINTTYETRVFAHTEFNGTEALVAGDQFSTSALPPIAETGGARWSSPPASGPSLTLFGQINPSNDQTDYFFQYVTKEEFDSRGFASPERIPALPAAAGHGFTNVTVLQPIAGLDPARTYVYRLIATNSAGADEGEGRSVAPPDPGARFYELISNGDSNGLGIGRLEAVSDDGERVVLAAQTLGDPNSLPSQISPFLARRDAGGWRVGQLTPDPEEGRGGSSFSFAAWFPSDLSTALWAHYSPAGQVRGEVSWTFTDPGGTFRPALPTLVPVLASAQGRGTFGTYLDLDGGAEDLSSFVFQREEGSSPDLNSRTSVTYLPGQPLGTGGDGDIYRVTGAGSPSPSMTLVNRDPAGSLISNACGVWVGAKMAQLAGNPTAANKGLNLRPVSTDGKVTYFSARPTAGPSTCDESANRIRIFKRTEDSGTVEVSKSQCTRTLPTPCSIANGDDFFQGASADGNRGFFTTIRQLTDSDEDATLDLYLYDSDPPAGQPNLVQASAGEIVAGDHPKVGSGAVVREGVVDVSMDGSRVYFVATGRLTAGAVKGANNLYLYQRDAAHPTGRIAFVAKLDGGDGALWAAIAKSAFAMPFHGASGTGAGDGSNLLFSTRAKLDPGDGDSVADLYRYDDVTTSLTCLTCAGDGAFAVNVQVQNVNRPDNVQSSRIATEDLSTVVFATKESLSVGDQNAATDAYEWHEGMIALISPGDSGSAGASTPALSADGSAAVFLTEDRLLASDTNSGVDAYSARIGGGFPEAERPLSCASPGECRTAPVETPSAPSVGSTSFSGPGNAKSTPKCAKGKVKKKGRCVKKKAKKRKQQHNTKKQRANNDRGGKR